MNKYVVVITGASSGFGALTARALSLAGHTVFAGMIDVPGKSAQAAEDLKRYAAENNVQLQAVEMDVTSQESVDGAFVQILSRGGKLDVVVHNAGHMVFGPAEAFEPEQLAELYNINVLGTQRVNRAALPTLRKQGKGLVVWVGSTSTRGGTPPYLGPYFAAKAGMDALAVSYAGELARWGIETTIVLPGAFPKGTNHFINAGSPADKSVAEQYEAGPYSGISDQIDKGIASLQPSDANVADVAEAIVRVVDTPFGERPFRVHIDPSQDGAEVVNAMADRVRAELLQKIGLKDLLRPSA